MQGFDEPLGIELPRSSYLATLPNGDTVIQQLYQLTNGVYRAEATSGQ